MDHLQVGLAVRASLLYVIVVGNVAAQVKTLPEVTVTSSRNPSLTQPGIDAARGRMDRTPGGIDVIDAESYVKGSAVTPADALGYSPGVFVQSRIPGAEES